MDYSPGQRLIDFLTSQLVKKKKVFDLTRRIVDNQSTDAESQTINSRFR